MDEMGRRFHGTGVAAVALCLLALPGCGRGRPELRQSAGM